MKLTVLGAGSWGTTVASLVAPRHRTTLWARNPDVAREINEQHTSARYLPDCPLPSELTATADLAHAASEAQVLIVGVPTHGFRAVLEEAEPHLTDHVRIVAGDASRIETDDHLAAGLRFPLLRHLLEDVVPRRALRNQRRHLHGQGLGRGRGSPQCGQGDERNCFHR